MKSSGRFGNGRWILTVVVAAVATAGLARDRGYEAEIRQWRADYETALKADDGWLTVAGLFWLKPGANRVGADPSNDLVLPPGKAPARLGVFEFRNGQTVFQAEPGARVTSAGRPVARLVMLAGANPPAIEVGGLTMFVIERGERVGIRMRDRGSVMRREFTGLRWFPIDLAYRVTARFTAYPTPKILKVPNILGDTPEMTSPGFVEFMLNGERRRLEPVLETPAARELFFIIGDQTNGHETYGAGRFLYSALPKDGAVVLDFNKLYNPPCAFTPFATCPLPPPQNKLPTRIAAGELTYGTH